MLFVLAVRREKPANNLYGFPLVGKLICGGIGVDMFLCEHSEPLFPISYFLFPIPYSLFPVNEVNPLKKRRENAHTGAEKSFDDIDF